ncbi:MAG: hypothetical protein HY538_05480 [Deltaproteobacteria bacterium]|nr:hypothetical protein [Deltaproteobacteria bacterium]
METSKIISIVGVGALLLLLISGFILKEGQAQEEFNPLRFWARSGNNIYNTNAGNVGIGIANPEHRLVVSGDDLVAGFYSATENARIVLNPTREDGSGLIVMGSEGGGFNISISNSDGISKDAFTVDPQGNVGIRTSKPQAPLDVYGGTMRIGLPAPQSIQVSVMSGGSLNGTYYYKIVALDSEGMGGASSKELKVDTDKSSAVFTWDPVDKASVYRVYRGDGDEDGMEDQSGSPKGYFETTQNSFIDDGNGALIAGGLPNPGIISVEGGRVTFDAATGGISWRDYTSGELAGGITITSVGELSLSTGFGAGRGDFIFEDPIKGAHAVKIRLQNSNREAPPSLGFLDVDNNVPADGVIEAKNLIFATRDGEVARITSEGVVQAKAFETGDIIMKKNNEKLWRMFEDENGIYLESLKTGKIFKIVLEET